MRKTSSVKQINKELVRERFGASLNSYDAMAGVQREISKSLAKAVALNLEQEPARILEIGAGTGFLSREIAAAFPEAQFFINDICPESEQYVEAFMSDHSREYLMEDAEIMELPKELDLIVSASAFQWLADLDAFVGKCHAALVKGGMFAFSTFGPQNFDEIRELTGQGLDYYGVEQLEDMLHDNGFRLTESNDRVRQIRFESPLAILHHIKATGVNGLFRARWTKEMLQTFESLYRRRFSDADGRVILTYHPVRIIAYKH